MKIVILDGHAVNPGDLSWDAIRQFGEVTVYEHTANCDAAERIGDADILVGNKVAITPDIMDACKNLNGENERGHRDAGRGSQKCGHRGDAQLLYHIAD